MRRGLALFGVLLLACSEGERDDATTIYGGSGPATLSGEGSGMSTETSTSAGNDDTTSTSSSSADTNDTADTADTADTNDTADTADTNDPVCGNGQIDVGEDCDGNNLGGSSCVDFGFDGGVLGCDAVVCVYDTSGCTDMPSNECDQFCNGCACPSFECTMCCANKGLVDACGGGSCSCF
jgi:hypothetical protein